jgi:hypothetical protein
MPFTVSAPTQDELTSWITDNIAVRIRDEYTAAQSLLTAFDLASKNGNSLNNRHTITKAIHEARITDDAPFGWPPIPAAAAAARLLEQFRITRKPANYDRLFVDLPTPVVVSRHQCPFCRRFTRANLAQVTDHMTRCWENPGLRCCKTCIHHQTADAESDESCTQPDGPEYEEYRFPVLHCPLWEAKGA